MACHLLYYKGLHNLVYLRGEPSLEALRVFAERIQPFTGATIEKVSVTLELDLYLDGTASDTVDDVETTATLTMKDVDTGDMYGLPIPDPPLIIFDTIEGEGKRVKQVYGEQLTGYFADLLGLNLEFDEGWLTT